MKLLRILVLGSLLLVALFSLQYRQEPSSTTDTVIEMVERKSDYYLSDFDIDTFNGDGSLKHRLSGDSLTHYPNDDTAEIEVLRLQLKRPQKADWDVRSDRGWLTAGATRVDLLGEVVMRRKEIPGTAAMRIDSRDMQLDTEASTITTDSGVVIASANWTARGDQMRGNTATGDLTLINNVVVTYAPVR